LRCAVCHWHIFHYTMFPTMIFILQYLYSKILALMHTFILILLCHRLLFYITWQVDIYFKSFHLTFKLCMIMHAQISFFHNTVMYGLHILLSCLNHCFMVSCILCFIFASFLFRLFAELFICSWSIAFNFFISMSYYFFV